MLKKLKVIAVNPKAEQPILFGMQFKTFTAG
jgi:hypothetical protein